MESKKKCQFGANCYRKNPEHLKEYHHRDSDDEKGNSAKRKRNASPKKLKQAKLNFLLKVPSTSSDNKNRTPIRDENNENKASKFAEEKIHKNHRMQKKSPKPISPLLKAQEGKSSENDSDGDDSNTCDVTSNSWTFQKQSSNDVAESSSESDNSDSEDVTADSCKTHAEIIKYLFLVDMPDDFYSFYEFCESQNSTAPYKVFQTYGLKLVGPFDVLSGRLTVDNVTREQALCHWRFFMDPPEMQTVLLGNDGLHYGYWRDDPKSKECFVASNEVPSCTFQAVAATIFGAVAIHLKGYLRQCSPFDKKQASNMLLSLQKWAQDKNVDLSDSNETMRIRKKKVVASTFHGLGIVVPVQPKTLIGYRPILETNANLKKICNSIKKGENPSAVSRKMEAIEKLVNNANIANDEGDFGNALELGIDLFLMGSDIFHNFAKHLLITAYTLLNRPEWAKIVKAHLKNRRTGMKLDARHTSST